MPKAVEPEQLLCPSCARRHPLEERLCSSCGMPLVYAGAASAEAPAGGTREWARKIRPEYARGEPVRVAGGRNQAEAELIQNLLIEEGVPSMLRRSAGFDVPDFLAAGPRDVLVPGSGATAAHEILSGSALEEQGSSPSIEGPSARRALVMAAAITGGGLACGVFAWAAVQL